MNPRLCPITRTLGEFISHVRSKLSTLGKHLICQRSGVQKMPFPPYGASNLYGLHIGVVWIDVIGLAKDPEKFRGTSDRLTYLLLDLCLAKLFLVFPNGLWSCAKFISPTLGGNLSITLGYLLFFPPHRHAMQDHRGIEKIVEATCSHVSHLSTSTLESRDEIPVRGVDL